MRQIEPDAVANRRSTSSSTADPSGRIRKLPGWVSAKARTLDGMRPSASA